MGWGEGGGDDDLVTQTPRTISSEEPFHSTSAELFVMWDHRIASPNLITSGRCELDLGISEGFRQKLEIGWGEAFSGMITTLFRGHPEQYLHTLARTCHTPLQKQTLLRRGLGFRGVGEPLPRTAGSFGFDVLQDVALQGLGVLKPSWQHLCLARYLQRLRTIRRPEV